MKSTAKILERSLLKTVFKQIRKLTPYLPINPFYLRQRFTNRNKMKAGLPTETKCRLAFGRQVTHLLIHPLTHLPFILYTLSFVLAAGCNTTEPPPPKPPPPEKPKAVKLKLLDVSCTEAFINVSASDTVLPVNILLNKNEKALFNFTLTKKDTTVIDTTLEPNKTYIYQTTAEINGEEEKSDTLNVTTLDTTSNNFTWQTYTFGSPNAGSSTLNDVAVISPDNIWAVGEINIKDTSENGYTTYNAVHWDGSKWELKRIQFYIFCGQQDTAAVPANAVSVLSDTIVWIASNNSQMAVLNKGIQVNIMCLPVSVSKIWAKNENTVYTAGPIGQIGMYSNGSWIKIESGTDLIINDINGFINPFTGKEEILCVAANFFENKGVQVIRVNENNTAEMLDNTGLVRFITSIWFKPGIRYYIVGNGIYEKTYKDTTRWTDLNSNRKITSNLMGSIRGNGMNDVIIVGAFGEVIHFNGLSWKSIKNEETTLANGGYSTVVVKGNLVVAVGSNQNQGVVLLGHHN